MTQSPSAEALLDRAIRALVRADAEQLLDLAVWAEQVNWPKAPQECRAAIEKHRALGYLLKLTAGNLRLLGRHDPGGCDWMKDRV